MVNVIGTVLEVTGLTVSDQNTETMLPWTPDQAPLTSPLVIEGADHKYRQRSFYIWAVLSTQAPTSCQTSNDGSDSHGHVAVDQSWSFTIWMLLPSL